MAKILLVDDVLVIRKILKGFLEKNGHDVTLCSGGDEAWTQFNAGHYDLVITDIWMENGSGYNLIERIGPGSTPVIAMTTGAPGEPMNRSIERILKGGAKAILQKPIYASTLNDAVSQILGAPASPQRPVVNGAR